MKQQVRTFIAVEIDPQVGEIPTPSALDHAERPDWLRRAIEGAWHEIQGDLDYDAWRQHIRAWALANIGNDEAVEQNRQLFMNLDAA